MLELMFDVVWSLSLVMMTSVALGSLDGSNGGLYTVPRLNEGGLDLGLGDNEVVASQLWQEGVLDSCHSLPVVDRCPRAGI